MVLEASIVCIDTSDWMRNGDYVPTRLEAQQDAVNLICGAKTQSNPENTVGVVAFGGKSPEVLVTLTSDLGKILQTLGSTRLGGNLNFLSGMQVAQLALKHRQNKSQHQRIIVFVGSPLSSCDSNEMVRLAKRLKKNNVAVDIINFGEETENTEKLEAFINAVNSNDNSHLVNVPPGPHVLSDILMASPIITGEDGAGAVGMFGGDSAYDSALAQALKESMEDERMRQEAARKVEGGPSDAPQNTSMELEDDEKLLQDAIAMSMQEQQNQSSTPSTTPAPPTTAPSQPAEDVDMMDDDLAMALKMSMEPQSQAKAQESQSNAPSATSSLPSADPNFLNSVLSNLPGVSIDDERIKNAMKALEKPSDDKSKDKDKK
eukprot:TRINITY_DN17263_c0_g1_i1.p1 TRINITY_DN17263_c0_g1~~TRINITY_DN17263_c0_g1_i1.p1  ORF type:complete len:375 (-),score=89.71 TRINITY_DN17263_c0_g1_i1:41-1165(-)